MSLAMFLFLPQQILKYLKQFIKKLYLLVLKIISLKNKYLNLLPSTGLPLVAHYYGQYSPLVSRPSYHSLNTETTEVRTL